MQTLTKAQRARNLRYKKPALASLGYAFIQTEMDEISEACSDVQWFVDDGDETLLNALDGDEDEEFEFRMAFGELSGKIERLRDALRDWEVRDFFDDCTVALIGNRYRMLGYDTLEEDYYSLTSYESDLAFTESGKKLRRKTKAEMLSLIGQSMGITLALFDIRHTYDYLKTTMDFLRDENTSLLKIIKDIEIAYEAANEAGFDYSWSKEYKQFDELLRQLPDKTWLE